MEYEKCRIVKAPERLLSILLSTFTGSWGGPAYGSKQMGFFKTLHRKRRGSVITAVSD